MIPKFRAWLKTENRMVGTDDLLVIDYDLTQIMTQQIFFERGLAVERDVKYYDFEDVILMQSTGLKDKNGKEIFEKDILDYNGRKVIVKWHGSYAGFIYEFVDELKNRTTEWQPLYLSYYKFEIVGNSLENPELLEVAE